LPNEGDSNCLATELARAIEAALQGSINIQIFTLSAPSPHLYAIAFQWLYLSSKKDENMFMTPLNPP
jgi:hypothetical protein